MRTYRGIAGIWAQGAAVVVLRALYQWSNHHYHRELLRRELWRIGRRTGDGRGNRKPSWGSAAAVQLRRSLTPG